MKATSHNDFHPETRQPLWPVCPQRTSIGSIRYVRQPQVNYPVATLPKKRAPVYAFSVYLFDAWQPAGLQLVHVCAVESAGAQ